MTTGGMEFRVLGPLDLRLGGETVALGGGKQRAVLAVLLLRAGEVVPVERLVDEVWGDEPPPSAAHTLESYVSRLRQLFNGRGPRLVRQGAGYTIELGSATLDAMGFVELQERASLAAAMEEHADVVALTAAALGMWRGPALADVALTSAGRAEADRLEELRLRTYELRFDAELALGRQEQAIGELQKLVAQNPYRERFVAQLMLALYRCGRHAEALEVYEQTRRRLDDDLGLQPSTDLQQLSGQIVRQDPALRRQTPPPTVVTQPAPAEKTRRAAMLVATGVAVAAALALTTSGGAAVPERVAPTAKKLALVLPGSADRLGVAAEGLATAADSSELLYTPETETAFVDPNAPESDVDAVAARIRNGGIGLVVALGDGPGARALARVVRHLPETRFVFIDASVKELSLEGVPNAAAIRFSDEDALYLGGYLSGLVPTMDESKRRVDAVSVVAGEPTRDTARLIAGFERGLRATRPGMKVRVDYSRELEDVTACEKLANRQIDDGSDVVVALAGRCSRGALAVARFRNVWGVGAQEDGINLGDGVLMAALKDWSRATLFAIERLQNGTLAMGRDTVLGIEDDYIVGFEFSYRTPERAMSAVIGQCSEIRASRHKDL
ncbi:MAG TPA: BTAD domain-containing putative transcriptional regulator [Gaiellaceae bacterium]|nr:BTAD domain-containing putative transcriptional regulator [Gaiellaceae bacterium]